MKKLLVTGGVLFAVMPAMAATVPDLILKTTDQEHPVTGECLGTAFETSPVNMRALYVRNTCSEGQYLKVTGDSVVIGDDGKISNASCQSCEEGHYCPTTLTNADIPVTYDNELETYVLESYGMEPCAAGSVSSSGATACTACTGATYTNPTQSACSAVDTGYYANADHSDQIQCLEGYQDGPGVESIANCTGNCSLNALDYGNDHVSTYSLVDHNGDNGATVRFNTNFVYGVISPDISQIQFCEKIVDSCAAGYTKTSVSTIIGDLRLTSNDITYTTTEYDTGWIATLPASKAPVTSVGGVYMCKDSGAVSGKIGCFMRGIYLNGHVINGNTLEVAQYNNKQDCYANCANISDTNIAAFFDDTTTSDGNRFAKLVGDRYACVANTVNINWGTDSNNQEITSTCTYGENNYYQAPSTIPAADDGYKFIGWKVSVTGNNSNNE